MEIISEHVKFSDPLPPATNYQLVVHPNHHWFKNRTLTLTFNSEGKPQKRVWELPNRKIEMDLGGSMIVKTIKTIYAPGSSCTGMTSTEGINIPAKPVLNVDDIELCFSYLNTETASPISSVVSQGMLATELPPGTQVQGFYTEGLTEVETYRDVFKIMGYEYAENPSHCYYNKDGLMICEDLDLPGYPDSVILSVKASDNVIHFKYDR